MSSKYLYGEFDMQPMKMSEGGRVVVPADIRKALNIKDGDTVYWDLVNGEEWPTN